MDARDTFTDDLADEAAYRERATALLDELAHRARIELRNAGIRLNIYFIVPPSGDAILTCGAPVNQDEWVGIQAEVAKIVRRSVGLEPSRCREIICAMTARDDAAL
jgi:hypothetical protein